MTQTDALGRVTRFEYDKLGRRVKRILPMGQSETYTYNAAGNVTSRRDFNGKTTTYGYDSMNRLLSKTPDASFVTLGAAFAQPISFTYSSTGRRLTMSDPSGVTSYGYDVRDRLITKATPQGTLSYTYDAASNLLTMRSANVNGVAVDYSYDGLNRLATVTDAAPLNPSAVSPRPGTGTTSYSYDAVGNLSGFAYPNGVEHRYTYNTLNRLTSLSVLSPQASVLRSFTYELGAAGNRLSVTEGTGRKASYTYDELYRLTSETITSDPLIANNGSISYVYDAVGNRLNRTSTIAPIPTTTSTYNANDQLGGDTYDANGSTTGSSGNVYRYDFENRLISLTPQSSQLSPVTYVYDGDGNRVSKTVSGVTTKYLVDTGNPTGYAQVVEEIVGGPSGGDVQRVYVHGHSLISQTQLINGNWTTSFYGVDGHGSVRFLTDASGAITNTYTYDAFGNLITSTGTTPNNYLYVGEQLDPNLGFYYLRARYMNPSSGSFWTMDDYEGDPFDPQSLHKYLYVSANPINSVDPTGQFSVQELLQTNLIQNILRGIRFVGNYTKVRASVENIYLLYAVSALTAAFLFPTQTNFGFTIEAKLYGATGGRFPDIGVESRTCSDPKSCPATIIRISTPTYKNRWAFTPSGIIASGGVNFNIWTVSYKLFTFKVDLALRVGGTVTGPPSARFAAALEFKLELPGGFVAFTFRTRFFVWGQGAADPTVS